MSEEAGGKEAGRAGGGCQGWGAWCTLESQCCLEPPGPQGTSPQGGRWDVVSSRRGWGGPAQPGIPVRPVWGWAPGGHWLRLATPPEAPCLSHPERLEGWRRRLPRRESLWLPGHNKIPRESAHKREAPASPVFALGVHKGHENLPRKAQTRVPRQDTPRSQEGQGTQARPSPPGHPWPRSLEILTVLQMGTPKPREKD